LNGASPAVALTEQLPASRRHLDWLTLLGPYLGLLLVVAIFGYLTWQEGQMWTFLGLSNLRLVTLHASVTAAVAVGMTLIMIAGGIDLSVGYVVSLVTVVTALVYSAAAEIPLLQEASSVWAIAAGVLTGAVVGLGNGLIVTKLRVIPFVATLGTMGVARGLGQYISKGQPVRFPTPLPDWMPWLSTVEPEPWWLIIGPAPWSVLLLAIVAAILLRYTILGRHCYAIGSNEATARLCGVRVDRAKIIIYTLAGLCTGWAGIIQTARSGAGFYNVSAGLELEVIAAVVIGGGSLNGGEGTISGTLIGALLLAILSSGCSILRYSNDFRFIVIGIIIVGVAALNNWRQRRERG
jgi:ribose transport system permease protein